MKCILITGGTGFLGSNLSKYILHEKVIPKAYEILKTEKEKEKEKDKEKESKIEYEGLGIGGLFLLIIDNFKSSQLETYLSFVKSDNKSEDNALIDKYKLISFIKQDVIVHLNMDELMKQFPFMTGIEEIYHFACPASPPVYQKDPIHTLRTNFEGTLNYLELAREAGCRFLLSSTSEIYGDPLVSPQSEKYWGNTNPIGKRSCYDEGKRVAETLTYEYRNKYKMDTKIVRIFNTYGPGMNPHDGRVVTNFIKMALNEEDITIYGSGDQTRSFCYVDDLIEGIYKLMNTDESFMGPVNIGNPTEISIKQLAWTVREVVKSKSKIIYKKLPEDDPKQRCPDITLAKEKLHWEPKINLKTGLQKIKEYIELFI